MKTHRNFYVISWLMEGWYDLTLKAARKKSKRVSDTSSKTSDMLWSLVFKNDAAFFSWSHVTFDLSKIAHLIQGQKCLKCFFEIKSLSKVLRKTASFLKHYDFSEMRYLIQSGFWRHMILCDAKWSYYEHKNHTKYQFYRAKFQEPHTLTKK